MSVINKVAILIDGGYFHKQFKVLHKAAPQIADIGPFLDELMCKVQATSPSEIIDILFRAFYYDCRPFGEIRQDPNGRSINFSQHPSFKAASAFHNELKTYPQMALRLGELSFDGWKYDMNNPGDFKPDFKQKSVDMKIGLDIGWMSSKHTVDKIVLVADDSDFVSPMKFARKEGILTYLYPMRNVSIEMALIEHADFVLN